MLTDESGEPFYVGITYGLKKRLQEHVPDSIRKINKKGLPQFCKKHELSPPNMIKVANVKDYITKGGNVKEFREVLR